MCVCSLVGNSPGIFPDLGTGGSGKMYFQVLEAKTQGWRRYGLGVEKQEGRQCVQPEYAQSPGNGDRQKEKATADVLPQS